MSLQTVRPLLKEFNLKLVKGPPSMAFPAPTPATPAPAPTPSLGGPAQDLPKLLMPCLTPKSVQTCSIYSPDDDRNVWLKKIDLFLINGCPTVTPPEDTSD